MQLLDHLNRRRREREAAALVRRRRVVEDACQPALRVSGADGAARPLLAFCSNDYLGLANHPRLIEAIAEGARRHGAGSGASHLVCGHGRAHAELEDELARWMRPFIPGAEAVTFSTGYMANLALVTALADAQTTICADKWNHASLVDGALLARGTLQRYAHRRLDVLETQLARAATPVKLIVTDAVFSMDGDEADLPALVALAERHDAFLVVDDAHGFGVLGAHGRGSLAAAGVRSERIVLMGTLGKAAGLTGAFVAAHPVVIDALVQSARPYIYTTAAPPAIAHALRTSLALIESDEGEARRARLRAAVARLRSGIAARVADAAGGWTLADSATAIQPLIVGGNAAALALAASLEARGLWVPAIRPPTVPVGSARLRITLSAAHTDAQIDRLLDALAAAREEAR